jgi:hypothetical protein
MLEGLTGTGKSGTAIMLGYALLGGFSEAVLPEDKEKLWKAIFAVDTENRSLNLFDGQTGSWGTPYGVIYGYSLTSEDGYNPSNYLMLRDTAVKTGAKVFIADSITHMWTAAGGLLDIVNDVKRHNPSMDNYRVWGTDEVSSEKQKLIDVIRDPRCHVITTVRVKEKFGMRYNEDKNKNEVVSLGEQQIQQEGLKYEPDLVLHTITPGDGVTGKGPIVKVIKSRYAVLPKDEECELTPVMCERIRQYLEEGADPAALLEQKRLDYVSGIKEVLDRSETLRGIWKILKTDAGFEDTPLTGMPLTALQKLFTQLTAE